MQTMSYQTCPNCGSRVYNLGCVNCDEAAYIEEQDYHTSLPDEYAPPKPGYGKFVHPSLTRCDLCGQHVPDAQVRRIGDTAVCETCAEQRGE